MFSGPCVIFDFSSADTKKIMANTKTVRINEKKNDSVKVVEDSSGLVQVIRPMRNPEKSLVVGKKPDAKVKAPGKKGVSVKSPVVVNKRTRLENVMNKPVQIRRTPLNRQYNMRDIEPVVVEQKSTGESFKIHQLTSEDMSQVEPLNTQSAEPVSFHIGHVDEVSKSQVPPASSQSKQGAADESVIDAAAERILQEMIPKETVKIKFGKFVNLVSSRDFGEVITANVDQDIIISSNLLTELAGAQDKREEKKVPLVFLVGIAIGVVLTYIFFST